MLLVDLGVICFSKLCFLVSFTAIMVDCHGFADSTLHFDDIRKSIIIEFKKADSSINLHNMTNNALKLIRNDSFILHPPRIKSSCWAEQLQMISIMNRLKRNIIP
jgi:hypothetical protein